MRKIDIYTSLFFMLLATAVCISTFKLSLYGQRGPGPGFMGFYTGVTLFILSFYLFIKNMFFPRDKAVKGAALINWKQNLLIIGMLFFYVLTLERLGFIIAIFLLISVLFAVSKTMKWYVIIVVSLSIAFASFSIFSVMLGIQLPFGMLSFLR